MTTDAPNYAPDLKPDKVAALLHVPATLLVTRAFCTELSIRVPSWSAAEKFLQEPLALQLGHLFIDVRRIDECDQDQRREAEKRTQAARLEPDPLGSIASMYAFATMISERLALSVDNVYVKIFVQSAKLQLHLELADVRARTTNALWQGMRDLSNCVDRSPDGLLRTRFKFVSFVCSVQVLAAGGACAAASAAASTPLKLLHEHPVSIRMTLFGQRSSSVESWEALSRVVDVSLDALRFEHSAQQYTQLYTTFQAVYRWSSTSSVLDTSDADPRARQHQHQAHRGSVGQGVGRFDTNSNRDLSASDETVDSSGRASQASFAWQVTLRGSVEAVMSFQSERLGRQSVSFVAQQAILNVIVGQDDACELQLSLDALIVRFRDAIVAKLTPERGILHVKQLPSSQNGVLIQWRVQHLECRVEGDLALVLNELCHSMNEKELSKTITCGTCHHKIRLDDIDSHVCGKQAKARAGSTASPSGSIAYPPHVTLSSPSSPSSSRTNAAFKSTTSSKKEPGDQSKLNAVQVRVALQLEELEFYAYSHLFHNVQQLMKMNGSTYTVDRTIAVKLTRVKLTTESTEFDGGAVFVPVLPLAFQMLECTVQDCGCWQLRHGESGSAKASSSTIKRPFPPSIPRHQTSPLAAACCWAIPLLGLKVQYPDHCFLDVAHGSITTFNPQATTTASKAASSFSLAVESVKLRSSFSDGSSICSSCHPQVSAHAQVDRVRCQVDPSSFGFLRRELQRIYSDFSSSCNSSDGAASTLFTSVLQLRVVEFTLWGASGSQSTSPLNKSLFKQVAAVMDNQLGYLSTQNTLDFRTLLATPSLMRFTHRETPQPRAHPISLHEKAPARHREQSRASASRRIQRFARQHYLTSRCHRSQCQSRICKDRDQDEVRADHTSSSGERGIGDTLSHDQAQSSDAVEEARAQSDRTLNCEDTETARASTPSTCDEDVPRKHAALTSSLESKTTTTKQAQSLPLQAIPAPSYNTHPANGKSLGSVGTSLLSTAEDLVNLMKMVAGAANAFRGGFKMVKSTHQAIETEVTQSLESAARLVNLPRIGMPIKSPFSSPFSSPTSAAEVRSPTVTRDRQRDATERSSEVFDGHDAQEKVNSDAEHAQSDGIAEQGDNHRDIRSDQGSGDEDDGNTSSFQREDAPRELSTRKPATSNSEANSTDGADVDVFVRATPGLSDPDADDCDELGGLSVRGAPKDTDNSHGHPSDHEASMHDAEGEPPENEPAAVGISDSLVSSLPPVVRLLVQVDEHRLCIPINPREKVGYLCREVVRRFNELFASDGNDDSEDGNARSGNGFTLSRVALHDRFGGVFSPSDLVGHLILGSTIVRNDTQPLLFFARPIDPDTDSIRPPTRVALTGAPSSDVSALTGAAGHRRKGHERHRPVGDKFTRCSMLPLPLVVALLASESEGELLRSVLIDKSCFAGRGDGDSVSVDADGSWPELALNAERLERLLPVEVAWFGRCLEVTHIDAFVLCLQQLGMCSSRSTSRSVGRALRERLRIEASNANPLVVAAWRRRQAADNSNHHEQQESSPTKRTASRSQEQIRRRSVAQGKAETEPPTYEVVKQLVQDRVGTYIRDGGA